MSTTLEQSSVPLRSTMDSLLTAISAFRNYRALALLGMTFVASVLAGGLLSFMAANTGMFTFYFLASLLSFVVLFYGVNGVGILLMNDAQGQPERHSIADALLLSLYTSHRLLAVVILDVLIVLAVIIAIALVLLLCKIPVLGPFLFAFVFPASAVILGVLVFSLYLVMLPLAAPAVWSGATVFQVIARINMVIRKQLILVLLSEFVLVLIVGFAATIIAMVVVTGSMITSGMSAGIIGIGMDVNMMGLMSGQMGGGSGHLIAAFIGGGLLFAVAAVIPSLIWTKGICLIYLNSTRDLDFSQAESQLGSKFDEVRKKAEQARERARELAAQQTFAPTATPPATVIVPEVSAALTCSACKELVAEADVFCGNCGHKLK